MFTAIERGMTLQEAAGMVGRWNEGTDVKPPSRQALSGWVRRMRAFQSAAEIGAGGLDPADGPNAEGLAAGDEQAAGSSFAPAEATEDDARGASEAPNAKIQAPENDQALNDGKEQTGAADLEVERGVRRAKLAWVRHGLEPQYVVAFERNELMRRRIELEERKHAWARQEQGQAKRWRELKEQMEEMRERVIELIERTNAESQALAEAEARRRGIEAMIFELDKTRFGLEGMSDEEAAEWLAKRRAAPRPPPGETREEEKIRMEAERVASSADDAERAERAAARAKVAAEEAAALAAEKAAEAVTRAEEAVKRREEATRCAESVAAKRAAGKSGAEAPSANIQAPGKDGEALNAKEQAA